MDFNNFCIMGHGVECGIDRAGMIGESGLAPSIFCLIERRRIEQDQQDRRRRDDFEKK